MNCSTRSASDIGLPVQQLIIPFVSFCITHAVIIGANSSTFIKSYLFFPVVNGKVVFPSSSA